MARHVLAGDIGGTKTNLALYAVDRSRGLAVVREASVPSRRYRGLEAVLAEFLAGGRERVSAAAFGIAGPVVDGRVKTTNLPWVVRGERLERLIGGGRVRLMNDLEATAYGGLFLPRRRIAWLARGKRRRGNVAVIAAGTGLGEAFLYWDGERYRPVPTEGGHADFAPRNDKELALLVYLQKRYPRVSYERVLSGPGLVNIFSFLSEELGRPVAPRVRERLAREDPAAVIGEAGVAGTCPASAEAVETFVALYGAQAGNLALTVMSTGGLFVGGGIAVKLLPRMRDGTFVSAFLDKGRYRDFLAAMPIGVLLDPKTALLGAAHAAAELLRR
ncbi:MAG: glucokinase [Deltaproteobacteria bacterium]|nr:glucokinase [Deltaproteobacteria bacterium]